MKYKTIFIELIVLVLPAVLLVYFLSVWNDKINFEFDLFSYDDFKDTTSRELGKCPFGHQQLKDIPISYGLLDWTPELIKKETNLKFWPGGCVVGPEKVKVVCTKCRYAYSAIFKYWERNTNKSIDFVIEQSQFVRNLPFIRDEDSKSRVLYSQSVRNSKVISDAARYWTSTPLSKIDKAIQVYLNQYELDYKRSTETSYNREYIYHKAKDADGNYYLIELMYDGGSKSSHVSMERSIEQPYNY
jgi:hypothetical protein